MPCEVMGLHKICLSIRLRLTLSPQTCNPKTQNQEMTQARLDSTFLTSFPKLLHMPIKHHSYFPPNMPSMSPSFPGYSRADKSL